MTRHKKSTTIKQKLTTMQDLQTELARIFKLRENWEGRTDMLSQSASKELKKQQRELTFRMDIMKLEAQIDTPPTVPHV